MFTLIKFLVLLLFVLLVAAGLRTLQLEHSESQKTFVAGKVGSQHPNGFYKGTVPGFLVPWHGKKFDKMASTGINVFPVVAGQIEKYPFKTSVGKGIRDTGQDVFQIEYNIPANPFWLHPILDEIVETAPGQYLGKLQVRLIPGYPFTLSFFELKK